MHFFPFSRFINYNCASQCNKSSTLHCRFDFDWSSDFFPLPKIMASRMVTSYGPQAAQAKWRIASRVISRFDPNTTSSWWRTWTSRGAHSSRSWTSSSLVLLYFSKLSHLGDLVASRPRFWWWTWNLLWRLLQNQIHFHLCMVFSSRRWTLSLVERSYPLITF